MSRFLGYRDGITFKDFHSAVLSGGAYLYGSFFLSVCFFFFVA